MRQKFFIFIYGSADEMSYMCASNLHTSFIKRKNQSGQAIVEYILVLIVVISVILGAVYQLNRAFRVWADLYFGEYVVCLLETGELPGIGDNKNNDCIAPKFEAPNLAGGDDSKPGGGGTGPEQNNDDGNSAKKLRPTGDGDRSGDSSSSDQARLEGTSSRFKIKRVSRGGSGGSGGEDDSGGGLNAGAGNNSYYNSNDARPIRRPVGYAYGRKGRVSEDDKAKQVRKTSSVEKDPQKRETPTIFRIEKRGIAQDYDAKIEPWSIGDYLRYLIMIAIILMVVFFIGGQAMEIFKSID